MLPTTQPPVWTGAVRWAIVLTLVVNALSLFTPIINEGDSVLYAELARHIAHSNNWGDLILDHKDWLDKPHFPFWVGAAFFKLGGVSAFTYILPGFLFHMLGGYYCYRIARMWYGRSAALLALLLYVSIYHLMYTSSAIKAEAFLTGSITGACYYWLRFDQSGQAKHWLLGALFTATAMMTKGPFTLITITSGLVCMWLYLGQWRKLLTPKWWLALGLSIVFTAPELLTLYWQFDSHPEKLVFGKTHTSGIAFFVWDSQFGRFFNSGPIKSGDGQPYYYVLVFLWAFLPWVAVFAAALLSTLRRWRAIAVPERAKPVFLWSAFFVTFALFSATSFQLDYYTVIVYPFAAVLCGRWLNDWLNDRLNQAVGSESPVAISALSLGGRVFLVSHALVVLLTLCLAWGIALHVGDATLLTVLAVMAVSALLVFYLSVWRGHERKGRGERRRVFSTLLMPVCAVTMLYVLLEGMTYQSYTRYSIPYNALPYLAQRPQAPVYVVDLDPIVAWELGLYRGSAASMGVVGAEGAAQIPAQSKDFFLIVKEPQRPAVLAALGELSGRVQLVTTQQWVNHKTGTLPRQLKLAKGDKEVLEPISLLYVQAARPTP